MTATKYQKFVKIGCYSASQGERDQSRPEKVLTNRSKILYEFHNLDKGAIHLTDGLF